jgi:hypothetical protein
MLIIREMYILEPELVLAGQQLDGILVVDDYWLFLGKLEHTLGIDYRGLNHPVEGSKEIERTLELAHVGNKYDKLADFLLVVRHLPGCIEAGHEKAGHEDHTCSG